MNATSPTFLSIERVRELHEIAIELFGGHPGILNESLLDSAVTQPRMMFEGKFLHLDLAEMAAAYLYHIVKGHPFVDGNKRVGSSLAVVFLDLNGFEMDADNEQFESLVLEVASCQVGKQPIAEFLRKHMSPAS